MKALRRPALVPAMLLLRLLMLLQVVTQKASAANTRGLLGKAPELEAAAYPSWLGSVGNRNVLGFARHLCTGVLVTPTWVLFSGACAEVMPDSTHYFEVGSPELTVATQRVDFAAEDFLRSPSGRLVLARLESPIEDLAPVELKESARVDAGDTLLILGWALERATWVGSYHNEGRVRFARSLTLQTDTAEACAALAQASEGMAAQVAKGDRCASLAGLGDISATCFGDSGAPMLRVDLQGGVALAGIAQLSQGCGGVGYTVAFTDLIGQEWEFVRVALGIPSLAPTNTPTQAPTAASANPGSGGGTPVPPPGTAPVDPGDDSGGGDPEDSASSMGGIIGGLGAGVVILGAALFAVRRRRSVTSARRVDLESAKRISSGSNGSASGVLTVDNEAGVWSQPTSWVNRSPAEAPPDPAQPPPVEQLGAGESPISAPAGPAPDAPAVVSRARANLPLMFRTRISRMI